MIAILIRHADYQQLPDVPSAHQPFALNQLGMQQAQQGAGILKALIHEHDWELYPQWQSSQMLRAYQTAEIFRRQFNPAMRIECHDALAERSMGCLSNLTIAQINQIIDEDPRVDKVPQDWKRNSHFRLPFQGAESLLMAGQRVAGFIRQQMQQLQQQDLPDNTAMLFFGHGAAFRHAAYVLGVMSLEQVAAHSMYHARPLAFDYQHDDFQHLAGDWKLRPAQQQTVELD